MFGSFLDLFNTDDYAYFVSISQHCSDIVVYTLLKVHADIVHFDGLAMK